MNDTIFLFDSNVVEPVVVRAHSSDIAMEQALRLIAIKLKEKKLEQAQVTSYAISDSIGYQAKLLKTPKFTVIVNTGKNPELAAEEEQQDLDEA